MKKYILLFLISYSLIFGNLVLFSQSQCPAGYLSGGVHETVLSETCSLFSRWCFREVGDLKEIFIAEIWLSGDDCNMYEALIFVNLHYYMEMIMTEIICSPDNPFIENYDIPFCPQLTEEHFRLSTGGCFTEFIPDYDVIRQRWIMKMVNCSQPPNNPKYCYEYYRFCRKWVNGQLVYETHRGPQSAQFSCPPDWQYLGRTYQCYKLCE